MNVGGWNRYHIIARGPVLMQLINGQLMSIAIDEDTAHAPKEGVIGFQTPHRAAAQDRVPGGDV